MSAVVTLEHVNQLQFPRDPKTGKQMSIPRMILQETEDLIWGPLSAKKMTYAEAQAYVDVLELHGVFVWRLPTLYEVMKLGGDPTGIQFPWSQFTGKRKGDIWTLFPHTSSCMREWRGIDHLGVCLCCGDIREMLNEQRCFVLPVRDLILDYAHYYDYRRTPDDPDGKKKKPEGPQKVISVLPRITSGKVKTAS